MPAFSQSRRDRARKRLGQALREQRDALGLRAAYVATKMPRDCDQNSVYRWERGQNTPDIDRMEALIRLYGLPADETWELWREASLRKPKEPKRATTPPAERQRLLELAERAGEAAAPSRPGARKAESR